MKKQILLAAAFITALSFGHVSANDPVLPEGMQILTPTGVEVTTSSVRSFDKDKDLVVAGSKEKGYKLYFTAKEDTHGEELWVSDGTTAGTKMVKDIYPGATSSNVSYITRFNDKVVFQATGNDEDGAELWISDGTEAGTFMLKDINMIGSSEPMGFVQLNETQFIFAAKDVESVTHDDVAQWWLWISDGTEAGTELLKDCFVKYPGTQYNNDTRHFVRCGRKVFFKADTKDHDYGETLWVTDGTEAGTFHLGDLNKTVADETTGKTASARIDWLTNFKNEKVFFCAFSDEYGNEPWVSDGTVEGTYVIADLSEGVDANGLPRGNGTYTATVYGDHVYFRGYHPLYGMELFRTDFTREGTYMVKDINTNPTAAGTVDSNPDIFCEFDGVLFMKAQTGANPDIEGNFGLELLYTDGTEDGTIMQSDLNPGIGPNAAWEGIVISGSFYFRAQDKTPPAGSSQYWELFSMDNKEEKPHQVVDLAEGADFVHTLRNVNGDLFFTSDAIKSLFKYHYRKPGYDPEKDMEDMEPDFGPELPQPGDGLKSVEKGGSISFYPNPAKDVINIQSESEVKNYTITDLSGRIVDLGSGNINSISVSSIAGGTYILTVKSATDELNSILIIE